MKIIVFTTAMILFAFLAFWFVHQSIVTAAISVLLAYFLGMVVNSEWFDNL